MRKPSHRSFRFSRLLGGLLLLVGVVLTVVPASAQRTPRPDQRAMDAARTMMRSRTALTRVTGEMQRRYRQTPEQTFAILRELRVNATGAAPAVMSTYRLRGEATATALIRSGYTPAETASALIRARVRPREFTAGMSRAGVSLGDLATALRGGGVGLREAVVSFESAGIAEDEELGEVLDDAGYDVPAPQITQFSIANFRTGRGTIGGVGVVDPQRVGSGSAASDGKVTIQGVALGMSGTEVRIVHDGGVAEGIILQTKGSDGNSSIVVAFEDFRSGELRVETLGGVASVDVLALSYRTFDADEIFEPAPILTTGGGTGALTWAFASGSAPISITPPFSDDLTASAVITAAEATMSVSGSSSADLKVEAVFPISASLIGTWAPTLESWLCDSFEIPVDECIDFDAECITSQIGSISSSAVSCLNPSNWKTEWVRQPPLPYSSLAQGQLTLAASVRTVGGSTVISSMAPPTFEAVVLPVDGVSVAFLPVLQGWVDSQLGPALLDTNAGFHEKALARLESWADQTVMNAGLRGAFEVNSRILLEFEHN